MTKLEKLTEKINDLKKALADELGIQPQDVDLDITTNKIPDSMISMLIAEGQKFKTYKGFVQIYSDLEADNFILRMNSNENSMTSILTSLNVITNPAYDEDERKFEQRRDDKFDDLNEAC